MSDPCGGNTRGGPGCTCNPPFNHPLGQLMIATPSRHVKPRLRSAGMRAVAVTAGVLVALTVTASTADALNTHPVARTTASSPLSSAITDLNPYLYWPLNDGGSPESDASGHGRGGLTTTGSGPAVLLRSSSNPPGGTGGSVAFRPSARQTGQYLRSAARPLPASTRGTLVVWFKLSRTLPGWTQTLIVDNGAATRWGGGLFIDAAGRLEVSDSSATVYSGAVDPNFCHQATPCRRPVVTRPLNDGRWHMAAFVDQYNIDLRDNGQPRPVADWLPSLMYVDGQLVDATIEGRMLDFLGAAKSRLLIGAGQRNQDSRVGQFTGNVSNVALFERLLTAQQISGIWQAGR